MSEAGIAWRVSPQCVDDLGVAQPPRAGQQPIRQALPTQRLLESRASGVQRRRRPWLFSEPAAVSGRGQRSRRNAVTAVGVRLVEAPGAPSRGEVHIRIPSGQLRVAQWRAALGDIHLSGDIRSTRLAHGTDRACSRAPSASRQAREMADCTMTGLAVEGYGQTRTRMFAGDLISWKDPL
jgi:hypothetical protein